MRKIGWEDQGIGAAEAGKARGAFAAGRAVAAAAPAPPEAPPATRPSSPGRAALSKLLGVECPVCRDAGGACGCDEPDRAFVRRTRFEAEVESVPRCRRCAAPLSAIYVPRPGTKPPRTLAHFAVVYACACCAGDSIAVVAGAAWERAE